MSPYRGFPPTINLAFIMISGPVVETINVSSAAPFVEAKLSGLHVNEPEIPIFEATNHPDPVAGMIASFYRYYAYFVNSHGL